MIARLFVPAAAALAACAALAQASAPQIRPGLWEFSLAGPAGGKGVTQQVCFTPQMVNDMKGLAAKGDAASDCKVSNEKVSGKTAYDYAQENLLGPIGASGIQWKSDRAGHTTTYAGLQATTREFARLGLLYLRKGRWEDRQVVPEEWVEVSTRSDTTDNGLLYLPV